MSCEVTSKAPNDRRGRYNSSNRKPPLDHEKKKKRKSREVVLKSRRAETSRVESEASARERGTLVEAMWTFPPGYPAGPVGQGYNPGQVCSLPLRFDFTVSRSAHIRCVQPLIWCCFGTRPRHAGLPADASYVYAGLPADGPGA